MDGSMFWKGMRWSVSVVRDAAGWFSCASAVAPVGGQEVGCL